jgi:hypothetical protein
VLWVLCVAEFVSGVNEIAMSLPRITSVNRRQVGYLRPIVYLALGFLTLGASARLGIVTGSIMLIWAMFWLLLAVPARLGITAGPIALFCAWFWLMLKIPGTIVDRTDCDTVEQIAS